MSNAKGFSVKSSHKFIQPKQDQNLTVDPSDFEGDYTAYDLSDNSVVKASISTPQPTTSTNSDTNVKTGSNRGMAIRTTVKSMEDWY